MVFDNLLNFIKKNIVFPNLESPPKVFGDNYNYVAKGYLFYLE